MSLRLILGTETGYDNNKKCGGGGDGNLVILGNGKTLISRAITLLYSKVQLLIEKKKKSKDMVHSKGKNQQKWFLKKT